MRAFSVVAMLALSLILANQSMAQEEQDFVLRTYEVGDLTLRVVDRPASDSLTPTAVNRGGGGGLGGGGGFSGGGAPGGGGGVFNVEDDLTSTRRVRATFAQFGGGGGMGGLPGPVPSNPTPMDRLIDVIVSTVAPTTWMENGTGEAEIQPYGNALVVRQTSEVHTTIEQLLASLRKGSGNRKTLMVDARWLLLSSDGYDQLVTGQGSVPAVDRDALANQTRRPGSLRAITNCFSGQLVYLTSGTRRNVVESWIPVVGALEAPALRERPAERLVRVDSEDLRVVDFRSRSFVQFVQEGGGQPSRSVGYQPVVKSLNFGAMLEIRPTLLEGSKTAVVDLKSTITVSGDQSTDLREQAPLSPPAVDRVSVEMQELSTTLRLPLAQPVLIGGMTYINPSAGTTDGGNRIGGTTSADGREVVSNESPQLYLVLEVR